MQFGFPLAIQSASDLLACKQQRLHMQTEFPLAIKEEYLLVDLDSCDLVEARPKSMRGCRCNLHKNYRINLIP
jgi:hypothetical protein